MKFVLAFFILGICTTVQGALKYEQTITFSNFISFTESKKQVGAFILAAEGDPDIMILDVKYQKIGRDSCIMYNATLRCYVSQIDDDFTRIQEKATRLRAKMAADAIENHIE